MKYLMESLKFYTGKRSFRWRILQSYYGYLGRSFLEIFTFSFFCRSFDDWRTTPSKSFYLMQFRSFKLG